MIGLVGLFCMIVLVAGLASLFSLAQPRTTTARDYTTNEVQEIIRLLREDPECRDTRLGEYFEDQTNSLELWEAVLGKPTATEGDRFGPDWTYTTRDGALRIHVGVYYHYGDVPYVTALSNGQSTFGVESNKPVDSAALKERILIIKSRIDPADSLAFHRELTERREREDAAREAEVAAVRAAEDREIEQDASEQREKLELDADRWAADKDYVQLRDALRVGAEKDAFVAQSEDWITRRAAEFTKARHDGLLPHDESFDAPSGADIRRLPLPTVNEVTAALEAIEPVPVLPVEDSGEAAATPAPESGDETESEAASTVETTDSDATSETQSREQRIAQLTEEAFNKPVTLTAPYPAVAGGERQNRISVQFAAKEIAEQAGFQFDLETSMRNAGQAGRRFITPTIRDQKCRDALEAILDPVGLTYSTNEGVLVLERRD